MVYRDNDPLVSVNHQAGEATYCNQRVSVTALYTHTLSLLDSSFGSTVVAQQEQEIGNVLEWKKNVRYELCINDDKHTHTNRTESQAFCFCTITIKAAYFGILAAVFPVLSLSLSNSFPQKLYLHYIFGFVLVLILLFEFVEWQNSISS